MQPSQSHWVTGALATGAISPAMAAVRIREMETMIVERIVKLVRRYEERLKDDSNISSVTWPLYTNIQSVRSLL